VNGMFQFRAILHSLAGTDFDTIDSAVNNVTCKSLKIEQSDLRSFPCTFEEAFASLGKLERMFVEPDGSFVWVGKQDETNWQLDGVLYDWAGQLQYVELQGQCFGDQLDQLLASLGQRDLPVVFQLPELSLYLSDLDFRRASQVS
jgi:hypothetical protein